MKGRMKVVPSNSVSMGSWYQSVTKTYVQNNLRHKFSRLTGCQRDPWKLWRHRGIPKIFHLKILLEKFLHFMQ